MFTQNQILKYRQSIEKSYTYRCDIINTQEYERLDGSTGFNDVIIASNQPCKLAYSSNPISTDGTVNQSIKLFIRPDIEIKAGSEIVIGAKTYKSSGVPAIYDTHQEVNLEWEGLA